MTIAPPDPVTDDARVRAPRRPLRLRVLRWLGWLLIAAGVLVGLYLVYTLLFTNLETDAAQGELLERWEAEVTDGGDADEQATEAVEPEAPAEPSDDPPVPDAAPEEAEDTAPAPVGVDTGGAVAVLEFRRAGTGEPLVRDAPLFVVDGVGVGDLTRGPGHYPDTALPGDDGNFAVAGHRTTYGAPFLHLDQLADGDEIVVTDRQRQRWTYQVVAQRIVAPSDVSVVAPDPLGTGRPTITLTTCHPRFSNRQRLIVFGELVEGSTA